LRILHDEPAHARNADGGGGSDPLVLRGRRPPADSELDTLQQFATTVLSQEPSTDAGFSSAARTHSITLISNAAWMMPAALFRTELGDGDAGGGRVALSDWELAQELTYAIGARAPGATPTNNSVPMAGYYADFAAAAADGGIQNPAVIDALVRANVGGYDPARADLVQDFVVQATSRRGQYWLPDGVTLFFREWLGYTAVPGIFKDRPEATSQYDDGSTSPYRAQLRAYNFLVNPQPGAFDPNLTQQMEDMVARIVVTDADVLKNLLTGRQFYLASSEGPFDTTNNGQIYNTMQVVPDTQDGRWVVLPANERSGVLTHPAWLGSFGDNFEDDPSAVHRGKWIRQNLLCGYVPPLSEVKVMAKVGPHAPDKNARARLTEATASDTCQACHHLMNPLGLAFETYNHAGYLRAHDHAADGGWEPADGTTTLVDMPDPALNGPIQDGVELSQKLADSPYVKRCFVRQVFRYFMGRPENRSDACTLTAMEQAYDGHGGSFTSMLSALLTSDAYRMRRVPGAAE
jgi:hypothetical protein